MHEFAPGYGISASHPVAHCSTPRRTALLTGPLHGGIARFTPHLIDPLYGLSINRPSKALLKEVSRLHRRLIRLCVTRKFLYSPPRALLVAPSVSPRGLYRYHIRFLPLSAMSEEPPSYQDTTTRITVASPVFMCSNMNISIEFRQPQPTNRGSVAEPYCTILNQAALLFIG